MYTIVGTAVTRNNLYQVLPQLHKQWSFSVEINPAGTVSGWGSIVHVGLGGNHAVYGDRTPGIWFVPGTTKLHIASAINGNSNYVKEPRALTLNNWTKVDISQLRQSDGYHYTISIDGTIVHDVINIDPRDFTNVKVSSSENAKKKLPIYSPL